MNSAPHPLLPVIQGWAESAAPPLVAFAAPGEFQIEVDLAVLRDPRLGHEHAKAEAWKTYQRTASLGKVLVGHTYDIGIHAMIYHAASGSPMAFALCDAAFYAGQFRPDIFAAFFAASRLDGFLNALEVWTKHFEYDRAFNGPERLPFVLEEVVDKKAHGAEFWHSACKDGFADFFEFRQADAKEQFKLDERKRKRAERGTKRPPAAYRTIIEGGWLPLSLWARTAAGISYLLDPKTPDAIKAEVRVKRDISDLKFSHTHHGEYQEVVESAGL